MEERQKAGNDSQSPTGGQKGSQQSGNCGASTPEQNMTCTGGSCDDIGSSMCGDGFEQSKEQLNAEKHCETAQFHSKTHPRTDPEHATAGATNGDDSLASCRQNADSEPATLDAFDTIQSVSLHLTEQDIESPERLGSNPTSVTNTMQALTADHVTNVQQNRQSAITEKALDASLSSQLQESLSPADSESESSSDSGSESGSDSSSDASSTSSSASDSSPSGNRERRAKYASPHQLDDLEAEAEHEQEAPLRTKHEKDADSIVIPPVDFIVTDMHRLATVGVIKSVLDKVIIVESLPNTVLFNQHDPDPISSVGNSLADSKALDSDTILVLAESRKPLGRIFETFGPVRKPFYAIRFNSNEEIETFGNSISVGKTVAFIPETCTLVRAGDIKDKGYDASNLHDEEVPADKLEHSDDEAEATARRAKKRGLTASNDRFQSGRCGGRGENCHVSAQKPKILNPRQPQSRTGRRELYHDGRDHSKMFSVSPGCHNSKVSEINGSSPFNLGGPFCSAQHNSRQQFSPQQYGAQQYGAQQYGAQQYGAQQYAAQQFLPQHFPPQPYPFQSVPFQQYLPQQYPSQQPGTMLPYALQPNALVVPNVRPVFGCPGMQDPITPGSNGTYEQVHSVMPSSHISPDPNATLGVHPAPYPPPRAPVPPHSRLHAGLHVNAPHGLRDDPRNSQNLKRSTPTHFQSANKLRPHYP